MPVAVQSKRNPFILGDLLEQEKIALGVFLIPEQGVRKSPRSPP